MNKTIASGLTAVLLTGGVGMTAGAAQASPSPTTTSSALAQALPLDLCGIVPQLCGLPVVGDLLRGVDTALSDLQTAPPNNVPLAVNDLVDAITDALTSSSSAELPQVTNAVAALLSNAGLDPAVQQQVAQALSGAGAPADLVTTVLQTAQDLVSGLLGIGGQQVDPARVQSLVDQLVAALGSADTAGLQGLLTTLLQSLPGADGLDASAVTDLVGGLVDTLAGAATGQGSTTGIIGSVTDALNPSAAAPAPAASSAPAISRISKYVTTARPTIRGAGTPGASVTVRTSKGAVLGTATVRSGGDFSLVSAKLKRGAYTVVATQVAPGMSTSSDSATRNFRVVSAKPGITTKSKKRFSTHRPKITGVGYPKSKITLRTTSGKSLGTVRVHTSGRWSIKAKHLSSGTKKIKAVQTGHGKKRTSTAKKIRIR